jgi:hypothetical protein
VFLGWRRQSTEAWSDWPGRSWAESLSLKYAGLADIQGLKIEKACG